MPEITLDNYERTYDEIKHKNFRYDIEYQEPDQTHSWSMFSRGKRKSAFNDAEALDEVVRLQKLYPSRNFRVIVRREEEWRSEPFHPAFIRQIAQMEEPTDG